MQQDVATNLKELNRFWETERSFPAAGEQVGTPGLKGTGLWPRPGSRLFVSVRGVSDPIVKRNGKSWSWGGATRERLEWGRPKSSGKSEFWKLLEAWQGCCTREDKSGVRTWAEVAASKLKGRKEGAAEEQPFPMHIVWQVERWVKTRSRGEANA